MTAYRDRLNAGVYDANATKTVAQLREQLKTLNLPTTGTKAQLEKRLADSA